METTYIKKILVVGVLAAIAIAIGYPVAVWALNIAKPAISMNNSSNSKDSDDSGFETISAEDIDIEDHVKAFGSQILIYEEKSHKEHREALHHISPPKIVLSAVVNITSSNVQNATEGDKIGLVLTKRGGNFSLLIQIHHKVDDSNRHKVYYVVTNNTQVTISQILIYEEKRHKEHREALHHISRPKIVLSAVVNITSSNVQNATEGDKIGLVLTKRGGNFSLLIQIHHKVDDSNRHNVYYVVTNNTDVKIESDTITISGNIMKSTIQGFNVGSTISVSVKIGSASITSGTSTISGNVLALIFKR
jgi:hypothetical protein